MGRQQRAVRNGIILGVVLWLAAIPDAILAGLLGRLLAALLITVALTLLAMSLFAEVWEAEIGNNRKETIVKTTISLESANSAES